MKRLLFERVELLKWYARDFSDCRQTISLEFAKNTVPLTVRLSPECKEILRRLMVLDNNRNYSEIIRKLIIKEGSKRGFIKKDKKELVILTNLYDTKIVEEIKKDSKKWKKRKRKLMKED